MKNLELIFIKSKMKTQGLGDVIERFTTATGVKKLADKIPGGCNCKQRKELFNKIQVPKIL
tara:strand:- start:289 stop:471 length:183 start_codon:yes stop_codon:yes gene_type:complete